MADISKISGVAWEDDLAKVNGIAKADIASIGGTSAPADGGTVCWLAISSLGKTITSTDAAGASDTWSAIHQPPDYGTDCKGVAFGKDNDGADRWIAIWDRGNNLASVSSTGVPTASGDWTTLDLDTGDWDTGEAPNGVAYSDGVARDDAPGLWMIVGSGGRVAYSSTGSTTTSDWEVQIAQYSGFAGNRPIESVCFSGSHAFIAGAKTKIVSGSVPTGWANGTLMPWVFDNSDSLAQGTICFDETATLGNGTVAWSDIRAAGTGADARIITISDSGNTANFPMIASGSSACCGDLDGGAGWKKINYSGSIFGDHASSSGRKMRGIAADGAGNWMIVGLIGQAFRSTDNGVTWASMTGSMPTMDHGQTVANTNFMAIRYAKVGSTDTWMVGGEDGYLAVSTDAGASWTACKNPFSDAGTGGNLHIQNLAFSAITTHPGASTGG
jgi:hypothetical protein